MADLIRSEGWVCCLSNIVTDTKIDGYVRRDGSLSVWVRFGGSDVTLTGEVAEMKRLSDALNDLVWKALHGKKSAETAWLGEIQEEIKQEADALGALLAKVMAPPK